MKTYSCTGDFELVDRHGEFVYELYICLDLSANWMLGWLVSSHSKILAKMSWQVPSL